MRKIFKRYIAILRPQQWLKNLLLLFPPFFGGKLSGSSMPLMVPACLSFSLAASCTYIINDIADRAEDRNHTKKKDRPIARGDVKVWHAAVLAGVLYVAAMLLASSVSEHFLGYLILYLVVSILYTFYFKHIVLMDMFALSVGYLLRVVAGGEAFKVPVSNWLFLTVFVVALFMAAGKRLGEISLMGVDASKMRKNLGLYHRDFLQGVLWLTAASALIMYALYTVEHHDALYFTVPLVAYGLLRYSYRIGSCGGDPTEMLLDDWHLMTVGILWIVMIGIIIYA